MLPFNALNLPSINDFEILCEIGKGAFSTVYKVKRKSDSQIFALKKVNLKSLSEKEKDNAFREIKILSNIKNDHIICYQDSFIDIKTNSLYLIMEYANSGDLEKLIDFHIKTKNLFNEEEVLNIIEQITIGLKALHDMKILHRDLKAANIFICGENLQKIKIGDLNVSKVMNYISLKNTQTGTPYYASPEMWNNKPYDFKSDIWSLGCLIYEITTLSSPFKGTSMKELYENIMRGVIGPIPSKYTDNIMKIIKMCLNQDDKLRPSADELLTFLKTIKEEKEKEKEKENKNYIKIENFEIAKGRNKSEIKLRPIIKEINNANKSFNCVHTNEGKVNYNCNKKVIPPLKKINYHFRHLDQQDNKQWNFTESNKKKLEPINGRSLTPTPIRDTHSKDEINNTIMKLKYKINYNSKINDINNLQTHGKEHIKSYNNYYTNKKILNKISKIRKKIENEKAQEIQSNANNDNINNINNIQNEEKKENDKLQNNDIISKEINNLYKLNIEQSKQIEEKFHERSHSAINLIRNIRNCSDNIKEIFGNYIFILNQNRSKVFDNKIERDKTPNYSIKRNLNKNSNQMFNIFHYQFKKNNTKKKIKKPLISINNSRKKLVFHKVKIGAKYDNVQSKVAKMIKNKSSYKQHSELKTK